MKLIAKVNKMYIHYQLNMQYIKDIAEEKGEGFNFDNLRRNQFLQDKLIVKDLKVTKTGTTIAGMIFKVSYSISYFRTA